MIRDLTALERNVFSLEVISDQQAVSTFCPFLQISLSVSWFMSVSLLGCAASWFISYIVSQLLFFHIYTIALQLSLHISLPTSTHFHPLHSLPQAELRQAGGLPGWEPRWCLGESASFGSRSLQDGRTALLWPIWPRPVLAPVCGWTSRGQRGWHSTRTLPVHNRLGI